MNATWANQKTDLPKAFDKAGRPDPLDAALMNSVLQRHQRIASTTTLASENLPTPGNIFRRESWQIKTPFDNFEERVDESERAIRRS